MYLSFWQLKKYAPALVKDNEALTCALLGLGVTGKVDLVRTVEEQGISAFEENKKMVNIRSLRKRIYNLHLL